MKNLKFIIQKSFKKIRIGPKLGKGQKKIHDKMNALPQDEYQIEKEISSQRKKYILSHISFLKGEDNNCLNRLNLWRMKQKLCPSVAPSYGLAKFNSKSELVSNRRDLLNLYKNEYVERLSHRNMNAEFEQLRILKENLFEHRLSLSKHRKTYDWTYDQLLKVIRSLKVNKSRDLSGLIYELFKPGVAGVDLVQSLLELLE